MKRVKFSYSFEYMPLFRQLSGTNKIWNKCQFVADDDIEATSGIFDAWVVYNNLPNNAYQQVKCDPLKTILVIGEPPSRGDVDSRYLSQFKVVITCHPKIKGPNVINMQQGLPWWVGLERSSKFEFKSVLDYDSLKSMREIEKHKNISLICSNLFITPEHRVRYRFVNKIIEHFGDKIDVYGDGRKYIADKWNAISPYKYHIVLENSSVQDYWTEKLADAYLGASLPIYWGCPNIHKYFPKNSLININIYNVKDSIKTIESVLEEDPYDRCFANVWDARSKVLDEYNIFSMLENLIENLPNGTPKELKIQPTSYFAPSIITKGRRSLKLFKEFIARRWIKIAG